LPTLIHTHGIGDIDYSNMSVANLERTEELAVKGGLWIVPTIFLARWQLEECERILGHYWSNREQYPHVLGFSIEGPLLGNQSGVPGRGIWSPSIDEWRRIAALGATGLRYIVMGPDADDLDADLGRMTMRQVVDLFYQHHVRIALGHFQHEHPELSAIRASAMIDYIHSAHGADQSMVLTDHLFNDMPRNFRHVWRAPEERVHRDREIKPVLDADWNVANLELLLGAVPAALLRTAKAGRLLPFLNFDGEHVDLSICAKTVEYLGAENLIGITDDTHVPALAGEDLHHRDNGLWYREDGIVAAGSSDVSKQMRNLAEIGLTPWDAEQIFSTNPQRALQSFSRFSPLGDTRRV
jgi:N-acetylglucosamine-6-phosphate deacetylase